MAKLVHEIVSNVDTIIVLKNPSIHFAPWEDPEVKAAREAAERVEAARKAAELVKAARKAVERVEAERKAAERVEAARKAAEHVEAARKAAERAEAPKEAVLCIKTLKEATECVEAPKEALYVSKKKGKKGKKAKTMKAAEGIEEERWPAIPVSEKKEKLPPPPQSVNGDPSSTGLLVGEGSNTAEQSIFGGGHSHANINIADIFGTHKASIPNANPLHSVENKIAIQIGSKSTEETTPEPEVNEEEGIHFHVCSGNLMSASRWFNRILKRDGWMESNRNGEDRRFRISAEDWDEEAFLILMNIIHLRNRDVPRTVSLETLAKVAVLIDYYDCGESIELFTDMWIADLRTLVHIPATYNRTLVLWIWISWVFKIDDLFKRSTFVAIEQCTESMQTLGLPIPSWIIEHIDLKRYQAIEGIISGLNELLDTYRSATYQCMQISTFSFQCGSMLFGALTKSMATANLLSPRPEVPFTGLSLNRVHSLTKAISSPVWYHNAGNSNYNYGNTQHQCSLQTSVSSMVNAVVSNAEGLSLQVEGTGNGN